MKPRHLVTAALAVAAVGAVGCGSSEPDPVVDRDLTLQLKLTEYRIDPANIVVRARHFPQRIRIVARNKGRLTHNVAIESVDSEDAQGVTRKDLVFARTKTAQPGETVAVNAWLLPGKYRLTCTIGNHDNLGQYGTLTVEPPSSAR